MIVRHLCSALKTKLRNVGRFDLSEAVSSVRQALPELAERNPYTRDDADSRNRYARVQAAGAGLSFKSLATPSTISRIVRICFAASSGIVMLNSFSSAKRMLT